MKYRIIAIDMQNDFATTGGKYYKERPSIDFFKKEILPFLEDNKLKIAEIISDYRQPRPGDSGVCCIPGSWGYESVIPEEFVANRWIKCMNSPIWTRNNIGDKEKDPGLPRQDSVGFGKWLQENVGLPGEVTPVLIGLTIDCCVLSTAQELNWRGYYPLVIDEGVDHSSGEASKKNQIFDTPLPNWAEVVEWQDITKKMLKIRK